MNEESLVNRRIADWKRLEELCARSDVRVGALTNYEILEFVRLYKRASTDLSLIRTRSSNEPLANYLNNIVGRAHSILYKAPPKPMKQAVLDMMNNAARTMRRNKAFFWVAFSVFFGTAFLGFFLVTMDRSYLPYFSGGWNDIFEQWKTGTFEDKGLTGSGYATMGYMGNNPKVSIISGAVGAGTMGLASLYFLYTNGALIGALASEMHSVHKLPFLLSSIIPHGIPEVSGLIFAAAGGLRLGWAILVPGLYSRGESLKRSSKDAVTMIVTGVILCFIAAPIEGFFSFNPNIPQEVKFIFACISLPFWVYFWSFFGKEPVEAS